MIIQIIVVDLNNQMELIYYKEQLLILNDQFFLLLMEMYQEVNHDIIELKKLIHFLTKKNEKF